MYLGCAEPTTISGGREGGLNEAQQTGQQDKCGETHLLLVSEPPLWSTAFGKGRVVSVFAAVLASSPPLS